MYIDAVAYAAVQFGQRTRVNSVCRSLNFSTGSWVRKSVRSHFLQHAGVPGLSDRQFGSRARHCAIRIACLTPKTRPYPYVLLRRIMVIIRQSVWA